MVELAVIKYRENTKQLCKSLMWLTAVALMKCICLPVCHRDLTRADLDGFHFSKFLDYGSEVDIQHSTISNAYMVS